MPVAANVVTWVVAVGLGVDLRAAVDERLGGDAGRGFVANHLFDPLRSPTAA